MPLDRSAAAPSEHKDINDDDNLSVVAVAKTPSSSSSKTATRTKKNHHHVSELALQLQQLQSVNSSQSSEIAQLKRQIKILSEFKGFSTEENHHSGGGVRLRRDLLEHHLEEEQGDQQKLQRPEQQQQERGNIHKLSKEGIMDGSAAANDGGKNLPNSSNTNNNPDNIDTDQLMSVNSLESYDPPSLTINSSTSGIILNFEHTSSKYDDLDDAQLEEFARIHSPKVSELLTEQALALDDLMGTPGWNSSENDSSSSGSEYDSDDYDFSGGKRRRRRRRRGNPQFNRNEDYGEEEDGSLNEEWNQLEEAQLNLKDELEAATNGFAEMYADDCEGDGDCIAEQNAKDGEAGSEAKEGEGYNDEWRDSIHQYYNENNNNNTNGRQPSNNPGPNPGPSAAKIKKQPPSNPKSYSLTDHAKTLDVTRPISDRGLYIKPLLSRHELETLGLVSLPGWITRPSGEVSSRGREKYVKRILDCTMEYVEPVRSKHLRKLFSGWNPGPGERKPEDDNNGTTGGGNKGDDSQRVLAYNANTTKEDDSSVDDDADENDDGFEDINGMTYQASPRRVMEPLPVRTVTIRIRCDVMCGAVMDALTTSVERVGGEMTKRQGGHLRAVLPGRKMRVWMPGERERERLSMDGSYVNVGGADGLTPSREEKKDASAQQQGYQIVDSPAASPPCSQNALCQDNNDDASSITSGFSAILSPIMGTASHSSKRNKGPKYDVLPPYIVDAQLVTKKVGKECQRLVLIRFYRMQDVARVRRLTTGAIEDDEEAYDVIAPLDYDGDIEPQSNDRDRSNSVGSSGTAGSKSIAVDPLLESKSNLKCLQEAAALVQRLKSGSNLSIDPPSQPMTDGSDAATVASHTSTKSYFKSFGDAITSPIRYFGGSSSNATTGNTVSPMTRATSGISATTPYPTVMELMSEELLKKHVPSPSVGTTSKSAMTAAKQKSHGIFPVLAKEDEPYVKSSWMLLRNCMEELDRRCLAYSTLGMYPIFQFPALPTLDVHFLAQIKAFCRESMIVSLVKTASELEIHAREFEVSCGNVDQLLRPTFEMYKLAPPQLPIPVPLTAYPLDFRPPEEICPPWGPEVKAALDKISNELAINSTKENDNEKMNQMESHLSSFELSEKATSIIVAAFQKQNDVEQCARLGRKNMQVMDRLAKMQAHKRNSIAKIRDSYGKNLLATRAGDEFHSLRQRSSNIGSLTDVINAIPDEVPLLMCNVLVGNAAGTCYVTHSHVLFNTQLVPILGGSKVHLFSIADVEVTINAPSKSVLSPLPASISFTTEIFGGSGKSKSSSRTREEVYKFIPSIGARRFAKFLEVLRDVALEDPNSLKFSDRGGLIYLAD